MNERDELLKQMRSGVRFVLTPLRITIRCRSIDLFALYTILVAVTLETSCTGRSALRTGYHTTVVPPQNVGIVRTMYAVARKTQHMTTAVGPRRYGRIGIGNGRCGVISGCRIITGVRCGSGQQYIGWVPDPCAAYTMSSAA
ncbi:MAG: hypothetical protein Q8O04_00740 [Deltaproteobacteria bacterium]|nr:hypothetical protein [Deltaproteobacteria bacterium]